MILIDYIYYQLTNLYRYFNNDKAEKNYGIVMTCALPCWNLISIIIAFDYFFNIKIGPSNKYFLLAYCLPLLFLIGFRYWKVTSYENIRDRIQNFSKRKRIFSDVLLILYIIISFLGMLCLAGYVGIMRNR